MTNWYAFRAFNTQVQYGYGTAAEADRYTDQLNADRVIGHFMARVMTDAEVADLNLTNNDLGFSLSIALSDGEEQ